MYNILLATIVFTTTTLSEFIFHWVNNSPNLVPITKYIVSFLFFLLFSFIKNPKIKFFSLNMVLIFSFFQMCHIEFYGMPVYPNAIWLMFTQFGEAIGTLREDIAVLFYPTIIIIPAVAINIFTQKKFSTKFKSIPALHYLFIFYFIFNPLRTYMTGNTWGRQPSTQESLGMNVYLSLSYFLGRILPHKLLADSSGHNSIDLQFNPTPPFDGHIIFIMGESLSSNHLSLYGYGKKTTPFLDTLKTHSNFIYFQGISSGVSTDISVAMMMNSTFGHYAANDIRSGHACLFKLAKKSNRTTRYFSTQSQQQLRYISNSICPKYIDEYKSLENIQPNLVDENEADDLKLVELIDHIDLDEEGLTVIHQRGSHSPYNKRYPKEFEQFKPTGDYQGDRIIHYDNTVVYFDHFMQKLITKIKSQNHPVIIIYASDHGEGLGEEGVWGHAALKRPSIEIPIMGYFYKAEKERELFKKLPHNPTHLNLSLFISNLLGQKANIHYNTVRDDFIIYGNDLDGFAGFLETQFSDGKLIKIERK